jgi:chromosomal replication initiation ATPase DnaA
MQGAVTDVGPRTAGLETTAITEALSGRIGAQKFKIWFQNGARFTLADGSLRIGVANPFLATWLEGHFLKDIQAAAQAALGSLPEISFMVDAELAGERRRSSLEAGASARGTGTAGTPRTTGVVAARPSTGTRSLVSSPGVAASGT